MTTRSIIGTDLNQVPTNGMLGGLAYQSPDHASITNLDLKNISAINAEVANTAVDIFVYDTSKDSDGGAWRKRTQHTSWYNETLNTATRGSRREFPAVAVIVITNNNAGLTIYDGDDPDLPMWMVFNETAGQSIWTGTNRSSVAALNGIIVVGQLTTIPLPIIGFVADEMYNRRTDTTKYNISNIAGRNTGGYSITGYFDQGLVNATANDVAMTVLPRAPIDPDTGLQVPTIAVATDSGVSVIRDDGTVIDYTHTNTNYDVTSFVEFLSDNSVAYGWDDNPTPRRLYITPLTNADALTADVLSYPIESTGTVGYGSNTDSKVAGNYHGHLIGIDQSVAASIGDRSIAVGDGSDGLNLVDVQEAGDDTFNSLIAFVTSSYNTGWMHGDIKGAFLADTDDTDVTGTELVTSNDFSASTGWTLGTGWAIAGGVATHTEASGGGDIYQDVNLTIGETYTVTFIASSEPVHSATTLNTTFQILDINDNLVWGVSNFTPTGNYIAFNGSLSYSHTFTATSTTSYITVRSYSDDTVSIDSVSVRIADQDRSVNAKGLAVYGTVAKSAVANGAELVAYSGWSSSNYLRQPYNLDLNAGTGDFYIMCWVKGNELMLWHRAGDGNATDLRCEFPTSGGDQNKPRFYMYDATGPSYISFFATQAFNTTTWHHCVWVKDSPTTGKLYIDGVLDSSGTASNGPVDITSTSANFTIGDRADNTGEPFNGSVSLFRFGKSAPSAEQIKKIYDDEKVLFQENAKCTLYGSSDAITALAYDDSTSLLHVGTSSGRSDFTGLKRINHTTTAVSTAISAQDGLIAQQ